MARNLTKDSFITKQLFTLFCKTLGRNKQNIYNTTFIHLPKAPISGKVLVTWPTWVTEESLKRSEDVPVLGTQGA